MKPGYLSMAAAVDYLGDRKGKNPEDALRRRLIRMAIPLEHFGRRVYVRQVSIDEQVKRQRRAS